MYFLIKSTSAFSLGNSDVCVSIRIGDGMGLCSGKIISDGGMFPSFFIIKYEFLPLFDLFSSLLALMRSRSRSISPKIRQIFLHWGYELTEKDFFIDLTN